MRSHAGRKHYCARLPTCVCHSSSIVTAGKDLEDVTPGEVPTFEPGCAHPALVSIALSCCDPEPTRRPGAAAAAERVRELAEAVAAKSAQQIEEEAARAAADEAQRAADFAVAAPPAPSSSIPAAAVPVAAVPVSGAPAPEAVVPAKVRLLAESEELLGTARLAAAAAAEGLKGVGDWELDLADIVDGAEPEGMAAMALGEIATCKARVAGAVAAADEAGAVLDEVRERLAAAAAARSVGGAGAVAAREAAHGAAAARDVLRAHVQVARVRAAQARRALDAANESMSSLYNQVACGAYP